MLSNLKYKSTPIESSDAKRSCKLFNKSTIMLSASTPLRSLTSNGELDQGGFHKDFPVPFCKTSQKISETHRFRSAFRWPDVSVLAEMFSHVNICNSDRKCLYSKHELRCESPRRIFPGTSIELLRSDKNARPIHGAFQPLSEH